MNVHQGVDAVERETLIVRVRRQPPGIQLAIAAAGLALLLLVAWLLFGRAAPPPPAPGPTPVGIIIVREEPVTLTTELPGRTSPYETSDVRPQVDGIIRARLFTEGDYVRAGQPLYRIDPATYEARVASARAAVARARASTIAADGQVRRYAELVKRNFVSRQLYDNALSAAGEARADVEAQTAALRSATIDYGRTTVRAPISGRIGRSLYTTGALVQAGQDNALTTIQRLDPIYVDIQQSSTDLLRLREQMLSGQVASDKAPVRLQLESGSMYQMTGTLSFADVTVDPATGSQAIRAVFPNPQHILLPGMFVRGQISQGVQSRGILVPQRAVSRDERGRPTVLVVGAKNVSELRVVQADRTVGDSWLVTGGLKAGDKVIVDAGPLVRPGVPVKPQLSNSK
ncbi:MAG TPA: efflux RND transporter periplasmic adaptor subunit [Sphingomicrobium sp.]|nr:efflux RND transporter periplasmic adaptor subunit [Sphingomicrobium sp.]